MGWLAARGTQPAPPPWHSHAKAPAARTALSTAQAMLRARGKSFEQPAVRDTTTPQPSRGLETEGIYIHSIRLPGLMAHQEVLFGGPGQTLSIRHDTINRECYMPGVILAVREITRRQGFIYGLDQLLGL